MHWARVALFTAVMLVATAVAAFPFGVIAGFQSVRGTTPSVWIDSASKLAVLATSAIVFHQLAVRERARPWHHCWALWGATMIASYPLNVVAFGQPVLAWIGSGLPLAVSLGLGVMVAVRRPRRAS